MVAILAPVNSTMLAVALPELRREFEVGHGEMAWLVSAYLIAMAVAQPLGGRIGDQLGRSRVIQAGLLVFLGLSVLAALAPSFWVLMFLRTGQGLVGASIMPNGMAMLRETLPVDRLGRSNGITGSLISLSAAVGPMLGAALLAVGSWRLLFLVNIPIVAAALIALSWLQYPSRARRGVISIDWRGGLLFAVILVLVTALLDAADSGDGVLIAATLIALPVMLLVFVQMQVSSATPVAEWRLFKVRSYAASTGYILLTNLVMYTAILAMPFFAEEIQGRATIESGILLGAVSIPVAILSPIGGRVSDSIGRRPLVMSGAAAIVAGSGALFLGIADDVPFAYLLAVLAVTGIGLGLSVGPAGTAAIESAPRELAGSAAGTNSMMRYVGSIIGTGILGAVLNTSGDAPEIGVFRIVLGVLFAVSILAFGASLFVHRYPAERTEPAATRIAVPAGRA
jgi:EmrB/QacA subfamily drug resistance transporter